MTNFELFTLPNAVALAQTVASAWISEVETASHAGAPQFVALSGGRIARQFFAAVVELAKARNVSFAPVHFFWADERCVPPTDAESNFAIAYDHLLDPLKIASGQIHRIPGELNPQKAAVTAAAELGRVVPGTQNGQPTLDIVFLGMGEDGHVASIFPGEPEGVILDRSIYRAVTATKPPPHRITLGYRMIGAARQVWVLASGPGKEQALRESLATAGRTPLARVLRLRSHTKVFSDIPIR
ncbi:MAG: 6-phosphogluconolactonase [Verrucomicrobia bacterium]|nr:6-phosphogluconolactonase [Verrucomicrobiota bacterium]